MHLIVFLYPFSPYVVTYVLHVYLCRLGLTENRKKQLIPTEISFFRSVAVNRLCCSDFHTLALTMDKSVYSWGYGLEGQCGNGSTMNLRTPRIVEFLDPSVKLADVSCGSTWSTAITTSGELYTWGYGDGAWLGVEPPPDLSQVESESPPRLPDELGAIHSCSFDSVHNVLRPIQVVLPADHKVLWARGGGGHAVVCIGMDPASNSGTSPIHTVESETALPLGGMRFNSRRTSEHRIHSMSASQSESKTSISVSGSTPASTAVSSSIAKELDDMTTSQLHESLLSWCRHKKLPEIHHALRLPHVDINTRDSFGNTPLLVACQNGHVSVCQALVESGASVTVCNNKGNTVLHYCFAYGFRDMGNYLIENGANEYAVNSEGLTCYEGLSLSDLERL